LASPYRVQSSVTLSVFQDFLSALEVKEVKITETNLTGLERFCGEFGFAEFAGKLSEFRPSTSLKESEDADARGRMAAPLSVSAAVARPVRSVVGFADHFGHSGDLRRVP
jgi:hypothetical protein